MWAAAGARGAWTKKPSGDPPARDPVAGRLSGTGALRSLDVAPSAQVCGRSKQLASDPQALDLVPDVFFLRIRLEETGEMFRMANCRSDMTVRELKEDLDLMAGIPFNLQRLQYLDQGDLMDDTTLRFHDIIPGGVLSLCIWHHDGWTDLVVAAVEGDPNKLSCLGITEDSFYRTANSERLEGAKWKQWTSQRAFVALYVTSHRGHFEAVRYLLEHGASCLSRSPVGRTALHVAAAMGRLDCIALLLEHGASIYDKDAHGETPIATARRLHRKQSERRMFLLYRLAKSGAKGRSKLKVFSYARVDAAPARVGSRSVPRTEDIGLGPVQVAAGPERSSDTPSPIPNPKPNPNRARIPTQPQPRSRRKLRPGGVKQVARSPTASEEQMFPLVKIAFSRTRTREAHRWYGVCEKGAKWLQEAAFGILLNSPPCVETWGHTHFRPLPPEAKA
ncbi:ankyrin repeat domain-containing protein 60 [Octodon degus]|uniref:Ankyrin repeat domain-containing protein 60 n=1 Tax=Octodon degus TaxID=10160 RepID=A0A6P3FHJ0_OCTDE|nr:ankyrin repeat domain-containing protein 60 [Octodon degus]